MPRRSAIAFGDLYTAEGEQTQVVAETITEAAAACGFATTQRSHSDVTSIDLNQTSPWYVILARALPQRLRWDLWVDNKTTLVRLDQWTQPWYRSATAAICVANAVLFWWSWSMAISMAGIRAFLGLGGLFACIGLTFYGWRLAAAGSLVVARMREDIHSRLRLQAVQLEHRPELSRSRLARSTRRYLLFIALTAAVVLVAGDDPLGPLMRSSALLLIIPLLLVVLALLGLVRASQRRPGFDSRFAAALPGLSGLLLALFILIGQAPGHLTAQLDDEAWTAMFGARDLLQDTPPSALNVTAPSGKVTTRAKLAGAVATLTLLFSVSVLSPILCWGIGLLAMWNSLRWMDLCLEHGRRLSEGERLSTVRQAVSGSGFLGHFRLILLTVWVVCAIINTWGVAALFRAGTVAAFGTPEEWTSRHRDTAGAYAHSIKYVLGLPPDSMAAEFVGRAFWCIWAFVVAGALVASVLSWAWTRRRTYQQLLRNTQTAPSVLVCVAEEIRRFMGPRAVIPRIAVLPSRQPGAASFEFGLFRRRQFIAVTTGALDLLDGREMCALISHEVAHLELGHCRRHRALQLLGRVTFVGDSFVGTLEHSFGYELAADRMAVEKLGIGPGVLRECLQKIRTASMIGRLEEGSELGGISAAGGVFSTPKTKRTLIRAIRLWAHFYTADTLFAYWHPTIEDRLRAIDSIQPTRSSVRDSPEP